MVRNCCVPRCISNSSTYVHLSYHSFPVDKAQKKIWEKKCRNANLPKIPLVCSLHFDNNRKTYLQRSPSHFPWTKSWKNNVIKYNNMVTNWHRRQVCKGEHSYVKSPKLMPTIPRKPVNHVKYAKMRQSRTSKEGRINIEKPVTATSSVGNNNMDHSMSDKEIQNDPEMMEEPQPQCSATPTPELQVCYHKETYLPTKCELLGLIQQIENKLTSTGSSSDDVDILKKLLVTTLSLLRNLTETRDTIVALHNEYRFQISKFAGDDDAIQFWTGFYSYNSLVYYYENLMKPNIANMRYWGAKNSSEDKVKSGYRRNMDPFDELFLTLVKLRQGSANEDLAERFNISSTSVSRIFLTWVALQEAVLSKIEIWMSQKKIKKYMPQVFKPLYQNVTIIIDCTEMEMERPSDLEIQAATYSTYKQRNTAKALVGISPSGIVTFISALFEGRISDNDITVKSGLLEKLPKGSVIMADRGWTNQAALSTKGIRLITPSFLRDQEQLDLQELVESVSIARVRIHVERCIGRIKQFEILTRKLHLSEWRALTKIWRVCSLLTIFWPPLV